MLDGQKEQLQERAEDFLTRGTRVVRRELQQEHKNVGKGSRREKKKGKHVV